MGKYNQAYRKNDESVVTLRWCYEIIHIAGSTRRWRLQPARNLSSTNISILSFTPRDHQLFTPTSWNTKTPVTETELYLSYSHKEINVFVNSRSQSWVLFSFFSLLLRLFRFRHTWREVCMIAERVVQTTFLSPWTHWRILYLENCDKWNCCIAYYM